MSLFLQRLVGLGLMSSALCAAASASADDAATVVVQRPTAFPTPLTEARIVEIASTDAPSVMASRYEANAAEAERTAAERARLPDVVLSARYTRLSSIPARLRTLSLPAPDPSHARIVLPELLDAYAARAVVVVPVTDAWLGLAAHARALGHIAVAKRLEYEATRARAAYEARAAVLSWRRVQGWRRIAASALEVASAQVEDQKGRVHAGTAPPSSTLTFEAARNAAAARLRVVEADLVAAEAAVRTFLPPSLSGAPLALDDDRAVLPSRGVVDSSPLLRGAEAMVRAGDASADAQTLAMLPRLAIVAGAELTAPSPRAFAADDLEGVAGWDITVQLEWSLSSLTTGAPRRERALLERAELHARADELRRQLEFERVSASAARLSAEARVAAARVSVDTATRLAQTRRNELAAGVATPLDATTAESERVRAELEQADAELDQRLAEARLAFVSGYAPALR
jgi:outer membrane protein TolC